MSKQTITYIASLFILFVIIGVCVFLYTTRILTPFSEGKKDKPCRIAIASSPIKHKTSTNSIAVNILRELSEEYDFEFIQIDSGDNFEWMYAVGEIHENNPLDLLIGVGWEASEFFLLFIVDMMIYNMLFWIIK